MKKIFWYLMLLIVIIVMIFIAGPVVLALAFTKKVFSLIEDVAYKCADITEEISSIFYRPFDVISAYVIKKAKGEK